MTARYGYSLTGDSQDYTGGFATRREARAAALEVLKQLPTPPAIIYVGRIVPADPQTKGNARQLLREMTRRADTAGISNYLVGLKVDQVADLDKELAATIASWLLKHHLEPKSFKVEAVSEYPLPTAKQVSSASAEEVHDLGQED